MRTIWKGHIKFSLVNIPVRLYTAIDSAKSIHFDWLTKESHHPVGYTKTDKKTGDPLEEDDIVKGYEYEKDQYVIIPDEDIEKVKPESSHAIKITGFIADDQTHPTLYSKPYFIGPESESDMDIYRLFTRTLEETEKTAVGEVVLRDKESPVLLTPYQGGLLMYKLRYPNQVRSMNDVPNLGKEGDVDEEQLEMAKELVDKMTKDFDDITMENRYYHAMKEMIDRKVEGKDVVTVEDKEEGEPKDIMTALKESINSSGNGKANGQSESQNFDELTKDELYDKAQEAEVKGRSDMNKKELIKALTKN